MCVGSCRCIGLAAWSDTPNAPGWLCPSDDDAAHKAKRESPVRCIDEVLSVDDVSVGGVWSEPFVVGAGVLLMKFSALMTCLWVVCGRSLALYVRGALHRWIPATPDASYERRGSRRVLLHSWTPATLDP